MDYYAIGQRIRKFRKACGLSQEELAEKVGISTTHMSHIETGNTKRGQYSPRRKDTAHLIKY